MVSGRDEDVGFKETLVQLVGIQEVSPYEGCL